MENNYNIKENLFHNKNKNHQGETMKKVIKTPKYLIPSLLAIALAVKFFSTQQENKNNQTSIKSDQIIKSTNISTSEPINEYQYILKEFNGKLAVFKKNQIEPEIIFDVIVDSLPEIDVIQLKQGLKIQNEQELNERIEDFIS